MSKRNPKLYDPRLYAPSPSWEARTWEAMLAKLHALARANPESHAREVLANSGAPSQAKELANQLLAMLPMVRTARKRDPDAVAVGMAAGRVYEKMLAVATVGREAMAGAGTRAGGHKAGKHKHKAAIDVRVELAAAYRLDQRNFPDDTQAERQDRLGKKYGLSAETVRRHLYRLGLGHGRRGRPPRTTAKARS